MEMGNKRLYRSRHERVLGGVCGGLGEYLDVDPVLIRVAWAAMVLLMGFGILLYLVWIFIVPLAPFGHEPAAPGRRRRGGIPGIIFGSLLIFLGVVFLADEWRWIDLHWWGHWGWDYVAPLLLMAAGVWFVQRGMNKRDASSGPAPDRSDPESAAGPSVSRRFTRHPYDKKVFGVCGGIGSYVGVDPTIIRLLFVVLTLMSPPVGILTYLGLSLFTPVGSVPNGDTAGRTTA